MTVIKPWVFIVKFHLHNADYILGMDNSDDSDKTMSIYSSVSLTQCWLYPGPWVFIVQFHLHNADYILGREYL